MSRIGLINPSSKKRNYQQLDSVSAIMPPHWMAVRASWLVSQGHSIVVCDTAVEELAPEAFAACDRIDIMPSGVHPHAFIHEQAGVDSLKEIFDALGQETRVVTQLDFDPTRYSPDWNYFDLTKYRAHNWHTWGQPTGGLYGTLASSISCPYNCDFCNIKHYYNCKYGKRDMGSVMADLGGMYDQGVRNIKMMDELFVMFTDRMLQFCNAIDKGGFDNLNIWGYGRLDTLLDLEPHTFAIMKAAGINWICVGIESGNPAIRDRIGKGDTSNEEIQELVWNMKDAGIYILGNYMFGFPEDTMDTMQETLDLALDLQCEYSNFYCMVPYPGTTMKDYAVKQEWKLPPSYSAYSQYAYDFQPLPTHTLEAWQVLAFRDAAFDMYHTDPKYLKMMEDTFGPAAVKEIKHLTGITLERKLFNEG